MAPTPVPIDDRLWAKVVEDAKGCWVFTASLRKGYGQIWDSQTRSARAAHIVAYELVVGLVPRGLQLDHTCRNRACVNPAHLEPVTGRVNVRRGARGALVTHCPQGHPYTERNTYIHRTHRYCRRCRADDSAKRRRRRRLIASSARLSRQP